MNRDAVGPADERESTVGGVVLAAGTSTRYGPENKLLTPLSGTPMVERVAETAVESTLETVVAVVGYQRERVAEALPDTVDDVRHNDRYAAGQSASVRHGVGAARRRDWDAVAYLLGDMPFVDVATIDRLVDTYRSSAASIVAPRYDHRRGNPVLFGRPHFDRLGDLSGDRGGREILRDGAGIRLVDVADRGVVRDIDTTGDVPARTDSSRE